MKKVFKYTLIIVVLLFIGYLLLDREKAPDTFNKTGFLLGEVVQIQIKNTDEASAERAFSLAFDEIDRIEKLFSSYDNDGFIRKINNSSDSIFTLEDDLRMVFDYADSLWKLTSGAFDAGILAINEVWGFNNSPSFPGDSAVLSALRRSGWNNVKYRDGILDKGDVRFDFGGLIKGYAVDKAVDVLKKSNIKQALIDAGSVTKSIGSGWKKVIRDPRNEKGVIDTIILTDNSAAVSGSYEKYFEIGGKKYSTIIDSKTGYPADGSKSVTVISKQNVIADALADAVFVLGPVEGLRIIEKIKDTEALVIDSQGEIWMSSGFNNFISR